MRLLFVVRATETPSSGTYIGSREVGLELVPRAAGSSAAP
jgi:hypothetical protein